MVEKAKKTKTIKKKTVKKPNLKRARTKEGYFKKDDPNTPNINEAYEQPNSQILQKKEQVTDSKVTNKLPGILLALVLIGIMILAAN